MRVLLVDDEPLSLRGLQKVLETENAIEIIGTATRGDAALEAIRSLQPELVLLDIQMPGLSGIEVASAIRSDNPPEVIFVTAFEQYEVKAFAVEAVECLLRY